MENIVKSWVTTFIGIALMVLSVYELYAEGLNTKNCIALAAGFALLWMRDNISIWLNDLAKTGTDILKDKFKPKA